MFDLRRSDRYEFSDDKVEYSLDPFSEDDLFEADVVNASETGLCILSASPLSVGQEITIKHFGGLSSKAAVVIWIEKNDEIFYLNKSDEVLFRIGLQFT